jgi:hypothetical protein
MQYLISLIQSVLELFPVKKETLVYLEKGILVYHLLTTDITTHIFYSLTHLTVINKYRDIDSLNVTKVVL